MDLGDLAKLTKKEKNTSKGGPRTDAGKWRTAVNAVRHGFTAKHLLLPGEDRALYEKKLDELFAALAPSNCAEAALVALVGDDLHRLDRLARVEKALLLGRIEELSKLTGVGEKASSLANAISALGEALTEWANPPPPTRNETFYKRYRAMGQALTFVDATVHGQPSELTECCDVLLDELQGPKDSPLPAESYVKVFDAARRLLTWLLDKGIAEDAELDALRAAIADLALPEENELRRLGRYRAMLEAGLDRRLAALERMRKLTADVTAEEADAEKSRTYRIQLRFVA